MAINFNRPQQDTPALQTAPAPVQEAVELQPYDIQADRARVTTALANSPEIEALTATIDVADMNSIVTFGAHSAEEISKASDQVLRSMSLSQLDDSSQLLSTLNKIMSQFDADELRTNPSMLDKLFGNVRKQLDKILAKYQTMGDQVDKVYVQLRQYEGEIRQANAKLDQMFNANVGYYHELVKYIVAGEQGCRELEEYIAQRQADLERTGDQSIIFELQTLQQCLSLLEQRTQDLRTAESVALQSIPMIRTQQFSNLNLMRKIDNAFIITLPVFKQALAQAIMLKRQKVQAEAISALDQRTNELLLKNARTTVETAKATTRMAAGSSIKADTLESTWRTIVNGIDEVQKIQDSARRQRQEDQVKLAQIKKEFDTKYSLPQKT